MGNDLHKNLVADNLHISRADTSTGSPVGVVTPGIVGQQYVNLTTGDVWTADGLTSADWIMSNPAAGPHAASHENGGGDEISVAGLSGLLGDDQNPVNHATDHKHGGGDEIATATPGANVIPKAGAGGTLADGFIAESNVTQHEGAIDHDALTNFDLGEHRVINDAGTSTIETWSASKIDAELSAGFAGVDIKGGVDTTTFGEGNIALTGEQTLNGLLTSADDVLVMEQTAPAENGIYTSAAGAWSRRADADEDVEVTNGNITHVLNSGSTDYKSKYVLVTPDPITVGTTGQTWERHKDIDFGTTGGTATEGNDSRVPTQDENDALAGTTGAPSAANPYVTTTDPRVPSTSVDETIPRHDGVTGGLQGSGVEINDTDQLSKVKTASFVSEFDNTTKSGVFDIDWNAGQMQKVEITGNATPTFTDPPGAGHYQLTVVQDGTGLHAWTHPAGTLAKKGNNPKFATAANAVTIFTYSFNGTTYTVASVDDIKVIP